MTARSIATSRAGRAEVEGRPSPILELSRGLLVTNSPVPAYHRLVIHIRELIDQGAFKRGEKLPPASAIAEHLYISAPTVRHALDQLKRQRLIRSKGRGILVVVTPR